MQKASKQILSAILCLALMLSTLGMSAWAADSITVYCKSPADWSRWLVYWWGTDNQPQWPGVTMAQDENGIWFYQVPANVRGLIFSNGD